MGSAQAYCSTCSNYSHQEKWSFLLGLNGCVSRSTSGLMRRGNSRQRKKKRSQQGTRQSLRHRCVSGRGAYSAISRVWAAMSGAPTTFAQIHSSPADSGSSHALLQAVGGTQPGLSSAGMSEADIVHGEAFTERKSTFQVKRPLRQCGNLTAACPQVAPPGPSTWQAGHKHPWAHPQQMTSHFACRLIWLR